MVKDMSTLASSNTEVLSTEECWRLLDDDPVGRLAVVRAGEPDIFPVNYVVDHGGILFRTAAGPKLAAARDRVVAFEADGYTAQDGSAWSVVGKGVARPIEEVDAVAALRSARLDPWQSGAKPWLLRIDPRSVTGRRVHLEADAK
jgi:nitroimidazol reductase NimA-like FMN-containing flavoprotein (pyridoxamine 5'-phosphate oxidase superfamily)